VLGVSAHAAHDAFAFLHALHADAADARPKQAATKAEDCDKVHAD